MIEDECGKDNDLGAMARNAPAAARDVSRGELSGN